MSLSRLKLAIVATVSLVALGNLAKAETATIGAAISPSTLDPQLSLLTSDVGYYRHIFDSLFRVDSNSQIVPGLATDYRVVDDTTWELKLRKGIKFHDGSEFDAQDVVFTLKRLGTVPGHDGLAAQYVSPIKETTIVDPHTIRFKTAGPTPDLPKRLAQISIISNTLPENVTSESFNNGKAAIGTGPFKFVEWRRGDQFVLARNDDYWGGKPQFDRVVFKTMSNAATRVAALEAGDVDMIDNVPPLDAKRLKGKANLNLVQANSGRVHFLQFDSVSKAPPLTTAIDGSALQKNPFADNRVRTALNLAISRDLIVDRVMDSFAIKSNQGVPKGFEGFSPRIADPKYDVQAAKKLLAEAGYPNGFATTLGCPNDLYVNDAAICQAIGQMWSRLGLKVNVDTAPKAVFFKRLYDSEFPVHLLAWGNTAGDSISFLKAVVGTPDKPNGRGSQNRNYSKPELDPLIDEAALTMDDKVRVERLQKAMEIAIADNAILPLHTTTVLAATKKGLTYQPQADETTLAIELRKQ